MSGKIAITMSSFTQEDLFSLNLLNAQGFQLVNNKCGRKLNKEETLKLCSGCVGIVAGTEVYDRDMLGRLSGLKVISRCGAGVDNIDLKAAKRLGIEVFSTPDAPTLAVAELTVGLILNLLRKVNQMDIIVRKGRWKKLMGNLIFEKKVGIIGFGRIGQKVGELLSAFGVELAYCDIESKVCSINCKQKTFDKILSWADILTLHLSSPAECSPIIAARELKLMKKGSWLINLSRGGIVDEKALYYALKNGHLSGAAVDVFEQEPYTGPLRELDNIILTAHIGSYAKEARVKMEAEAVRNLLRGLRVSID
ncbi:unnamed protein product [marine sediment metagenome]|uniref:S-adenosyl-L-homocysteine hydrolase NAD binding domain-containing protein n=1 Tax=marine sediment metagenome TaxID=412755 RepID=X0STW9_9ZZZZ